MQNQHDLEHRYRKLTSLIENVHRMTARRREDMNGPQIGVVVNDDITIWGTVPADPAQDEPFIEDLVQKAKGEAKKQD